MSDERQIVNSSLWAAFGDALGFTTELGDEKTFRYRFGGQTEEWGRGAWKRKIGGKYGCQIEFPPGTYSDDTQLRLAVSRAINSDGIFQKEAFAKLELPAWRCYALGAGVGSLAAADNIVKASVAWNSNFYSSKVDYRNGGGNGAAMRIQPHIWAATNREHPHSYILDIFSDAIVTHGHARGILGAIFHGICLAMTLVYQKPLTCGQWHNILPFLEDIPSLIQKDAFLSTVWLPTWEKGAPMPFAAQAGAVIEEYRGYMDEFPRHTTGSPAERYRSFARAIGAVGGKERGSAIKTTILASAAALLFAEEDPASCLRTVAALFDSDTDTIATMAGALLGATVPHEPDYPVQDREYLKKEASRLYNISQKLPAETFAYHSMLEWRPPRSALDQVKRYRDVYYIDGLTPLATLEGEYANASTVWQFATTSFGQTLLVKRRESVPETESEPKCGTYRIRIKRPTPDTAVLTAQPPHAEQLPLLPKDQMGTPGRYTSPPLPEDGLANIIEDIRQSRFSPKRIGEHILAIEKKYDYERLIDFVSLFHKAWKNQHGR